MLAIAIVRIAIAITRTHFIIGGDSGLQSTINHLHTAYFPLIALVECVSAYFLLSTFAKTNTNSLERAIRTGLFRYLMRSTEVRLTFLAIIGTIRAITYSFQSTAQSATNMAGQMDQENLNARQTNCSQHRHAILQGRPHEPKLQRVATHPAEPSLQGDEAVHHHWWEGRRGGSFRSS